MDTEFAAKAELFAVLGGLQKSRVIFDLQNDRVDGWLEVTEPRRVRQLCSRIGQHRLIRVPFVIQIQRVVPAAKCHALDATVSGGNLPRTLNTCRRLDNGHQVQTPHSHTLPRFGCGQQVFQLIEAGP